MRTSMQERKSGEIKIDYELVLDSAIRENITGESCGIKIQLYIDKDPPIHIYHEYVIGDDVSKSTLLMRHHATAHHFVHEIADAIINRYSIPEKLKALTQGILWYRGKHDE